MRIEKSATEWFDLVVAGAGSGGIGAALAAARSGLKVLLVEKSDSVGGNAVRGGVLNWEPGVGGTAFPREIYRRLRAESGAAAVWSFGRHCLWPREGQAPFWPGGECLVDESRKYEATLRRHAPRGTKVDEAFCREAWHGVVFEPGAYCRVVEAMLAETGNCRVLKRIRVTGVAGDRGWISGVELRDEETGLEFSAGADYVIDATADAVLCRMVECEFLQGAESQSQFGEPGAPLTGNSEAVNAVTLMYRVSPRSHSAVDPVTSDIPSRCPWQAHWPAAQFVQFPCGDRNVNMLPTMNGREFMAYFEAGEGGYRHAYEECRRRVLGHWHFLQENWDEFRSFELTWIAPGLGVRETRRVVGEYVLTQHDLLAGLSGQRHQDIVAIADHALDVHGEHSKGCIELHEPYGVPLRAMVPRGWKNLMVACRGASFSQIAASSCRLSRTMMDLGHAAGLAVALARPGNSAILDVDSAALRARLARDGATLEWPAR